ncbi:MAG: ABC transporter substrate-binding protein [Actinomycetota bacterium]|nr:ABC transporter substrate-binding protein [Actinomycetota bacterium]
MKRGPSSSHRRSRGVSDAPAPEQPDRPEGAAPVGGEPVGPAFVGRHGEVERLHEAFVGVAGARPRSAVGRPVATPVVFVAAEAGGGKTALVSHFLSEVQAGDEPVIVATGHCDAHTGMSDPYLPFREILATVTGTLRAAAGAEGSAKQPTSRARRLQQYSFEVAAEIGPELMMLLVAGVPGLGIGLGAGRAVARRAGWLEKLGSGRKQAPPPGSASFAAGATDVSFDDERVFEQFTRFLTTVAAEAPLVLVLDDLHWADAPSIGLLFHLARHLDRSRVLIVGAYRPDEVAIGRGGDRHPLDKALAELKRIHGEIVIDLDRATRSEGRQFVDAFVDSEPNRLGSSFRDLLYARTGGHALFTVELLRHMQERGDLVTDDNGDWVEHPSLNWAALPARVEGVIEERISRLNQGLRQLLQVASAEGSDFTGQIVARVEDLPERAVLRDLAQEIAKRHRLVTESGDIKVKGQVLARFEFRHALFQQYLYAELGTGERRQLHSEIARVLEELYGDHCTEIAVKLARHHCEADQEAKAVPYLLHAGDQARSLYALQEAIDAYRRALAIMKEHHDIAGAARTLMKLGLTYHNAFDFDKSRQAYDEGFDFWQRAGDVQHGHLPPSPHPLRLDWPEPETLDPAMCAEMWSGGVIDQLFCGLLEVSPEMNVIPDAASRWEVTDGGRRYRFHLRSDRLWTDGTRLTAHDFEFAWKRVLDPATVSPVASLLYAIRGARAFHEGTGDRDLVGVRAADDETLDVELEHPAAYFPHLIAFTVARAVPRHVVAANGPAWTTASCIATCGAFKFGHWEPGDVMVLTADDHFRGTKVGNIHSIELRLGDPESLTDDYDSNGLDVLALRRLPEHVRWRVRQQHATDLLSIPWMATHFVAFNDRRTPFSDYRVRQALAHAIDQSTLADIVMHGDAFPAMGGLLPLGMPGHAPGIALGFDPDRARQLLADAGYAGGTGFPPVQALSFGAVTTPREFVGHQWRQILGIDVSWKDSTSPIWDPTRQPDVFVCAWAADFPDPDNFLGLYLERFRPTAVDDPFRQQLERARRATDASKRVQSYGLADRVLVEEALCIPLIYDRLQLLVRPWVKKFPTSAQNWWFWKDAVIEAHQT